MANNTVRTAVVLLVLFATFAVGIPYISGVVDAWLFTDASGVPADPASAEFPATQGQPKNRVEQAAFVETAEPRSSELAFEYREDVGPSASHRSVEPIDFQDPLPRPYEEAANEDAPELEDLQQRIEQLGAAHLVVERLPTNHFECRTLFPIAPESSYQKAFSATASSPQAAMEQVIAEVQVWQRRSRR